MTQAELEDFLHNHIPLTAAMAVAVIKAGGDEVIIEAPLEPNINVHGTVFGGSAATLGVLAAWSVLHLRLFEAGLDNRLVIHKQTTDYLAPLEGRFRATARIEDALWDEFIATFRRRRRARITIMAEIAADGVTGARMVGEFVALAE